MNKIFSILLVLFSFLNVGVVSGQEYDWEFKKETNGIKVYTRDVAGSNLKVLKIIMDTDVSINAIMRLLMDTDSYTKWVYKCSHSSPVVINSALNTLDYYQIDFPWPFSDRDLYTNTVTTIHPETGVITSSSTGVAYAPKRTGFVRVPTHFNQWIVTPISENKTHIEYSLQSTPGGSIPNWLVNLAVDQGPMRSMKAFLKMVNSPSYTEGGEWLLDIVPSTETSKEQK